MVDRRVRVERDVRAGRSADVLARDLSPVHVCDVGVVIVDVQIEPIQDACELRLELELEPDVDGASLCVGRVVTISITEPARSRGPRGVVKADVPVSPCVTKGW